MANNLAPIHSRSLSELTTLAEEDPHELHIEQGLPQQVMDSLEQTPSLKGPCASLEANFSTEDEVPNAPRTPAKKAATLANESGSAPHLLGIKNPSLQCSIQTLCQN